MWLELWLICVRREQDHHRFRELVHDAGILALLHALKSGSIMVFTVRLISCQ